MVLLVLNENSTARKRSWAAFKWRAIGLQIVVTAAKPMRYGRIVQGAN